MAKGPKVGLAPCRVGEVGVRSVPGAAVGVVKLVDEGLRVFWQEDIGIEEMGRAGLGTGAARHCVGSAWAGLWLSVSRSLLTWCGHEGVKGQWRIQDLCADKAFQEVVGSAWGTNESARVTCRQSATVKQQVCQTDGMCSHDPCMVHLYSCGRIVG